MEELCNACPHMRKSVDTEEFWGFSCTRETWQCDLLCHDAEDPDCPMNEVWMKIAEAGDETGDYDLSVAMEW
jgi:hypothetical protein